MTRVEVSILELKYHGRYTDVSTGYEQLGKIKPHEQKKNILTWENHKYFDGAIKHIEYKKLQSF